jgi:hypothetical protein
VFRLSNILAHILPSCPAAFLLAKKPNLWILLAIDKAYHWPLRKHQLHSAWSRAIRSGIGTPGIEVYHAVLQIYPISEAVLKISYLAAVFSIGLALLSPLHVAAEKAGTHATNAAAGMPANEGKVLSTLDAPGYTYMELANTEKRFWIAAPTTRVKVGDRVRFEQSMVMKNFNSKTLNRTFDQIIFVNSAAILN